MNRVYTGVRKNIISVFITLNYQSLWHFPEVGSRLFLLPPIFLPLCSFCDKSRAAQTPEISIAKVQFGKKPCLPIRAKAKQQQQQKEDFLDSDLLSVHSTKSFTLFLTHGLACAINGLRTENVFKIQSHVFSRSKQAHFSLKWDFFLAKNRNFLRKNTFYDFQWFLLFKLFITHL